MIITVITTVITTVISTTECDMCVTIGDNTKQLIP